MNVKRRAKTRSAIAYKSHYKSLARAAYCTGDGPHNFIDVGPSVRNKYEPSMREVRMLCTKCKASGIRSYHD